MTKPIEDMTKAELLEEVRRLTGAPSPVPSIELLDCPCCGGKADFDAVNEAANEWLVRCTVCDLNTVPRPREETAAQWNKRVQSNASNESFERSEAG